MNRNWENLRKRLEAIRTRREQLAYLKKQADYAASVWQHHAQVPVQWKGTPIVEYVD